MKKSDFRGFKQVFMFEFLTGIKKTSFKVFIAIICAMAFLAMPVTIVIGKIKGEDNSSDKASSKSAIESIYVCDNTDLSIDYSHLNSSDKYSDVAIIVDKDLSFSDAVKKLEDGSEHKNLVIKTEYDSKGGFDVTIVHSPKAGIKKAALESFEKEFSTFFKEEVLINQNVSEDDYEYLSEGINISIMKQAKDGSFIEDSGKISVSDYFVIWGGLMILFMLINMSSGNVATSIATEKSSRVIEFLLTETRPLALLSGKIAARLLETFITCFAAYSCYFLSQLVCIFFMSGTATADSSSSNIVVVSSVWETITPSKLLIAVLYFLAGLALFSIMGALAGASVSKLDELQDAYKLYSFIMILCVYGDMFLVVMMLNAGGVDAVSNFCSIFPLTGAFITPALIITGKISIITGIIALVIIVITAVAAFILASAIYESMLLFQGKRLGIKDVISLMKKQVVA